jgi:PLP dependent protein
MILEKIKTIFKDLPERVIVVAAAKGRSPEEIETAINAGIGVIGENYIQEAGKHIATLGNKAKWHFIGHLQKNKVKPAVSLFDMIETLDSVSLAERLDKECARQNKIMPVLAEINSACEPQKAGIMPDEAEEFINQITSFKNLSLSGLMTMGPWLAEAEKIRPYFKITKELFDKIAKNQPREEWKYLSMGMSSSYKIAIEEGATMVRIGEAIFGPRRKNKNEG